MPKLTGSQRKAKKKQQLAEANAKLSAVLSTAAKGTLVEAHPITTMHVELVPPQLTLHLIGGPLREVVRSLGATGKATSRQGLAGRLAAVLHPLASSFFLTRVNKTQKVGVVIAEANGCDIEDLMSPAGYFSTVSLPMFYLELLDFNKYVRRMWVERNPQLKDSEELEVMVQDMRNALDATPANHCPLFMTYIHREDKTGFSTETFHLALPGNSGSRFFDGLVKAVQMKDAQLIEIQLPEGKVSLFDMAHGPSTGASWAAISKDPQAVAAALQGFLYQPEVKSVLMAFAGASYKCHGKGAVFLFSKNGIDDLTRTNPKWDWADSNLSPFNSGNSYKRLDRQFLLVWGRAEGDGEMAAWSLAANMMAQVETLALVIENSVPGENFAVVICADPTGTNMPPSLAAEVRTPDTQVVPEPMEATIAVVGPIPFVDGCTFQAAQGCSIWPDGAGMALVNVDRE